MAALSASLLALFALTSVTGCGDGGAQEGKPAAEWSNDAEFKEKLDTEHSVAKEIGARRAKVQRRMDEMVAIMKEKLGVKDEKKAIESLADNAEWKSLKEKAAKIDAEFEKQRQEMLSLVRRQMNQGKSSK